MPAVLLRAHDRDAPHDAPARLVAVEHERGESLARVVGRLREQDEVLRDARAGDEPLAAVHDPLVALRLVAVVSIIVGSEPAPGAGSVMTIDERTLPSTIGCSQRVFCRSRADLVEHRHVAVVGRRAVEHDRPEDRVVHLLVARGHADDVEPLPAALLRHLRRPQAGGFRLRAQLLEQVEADVLVLVERLGVALERQQVLQHEVAVALAVVFDFRASVKSMCILSVSCSVFARSRRTNFWILPVAFFGSSPNTTRFGALKCASGVARVRDQRRPRSRPRRA